MQATAAPSSRSGRSAELAASPSTLADAVRLFVSQPSPRTLLALVVGAAGLRAILGDPSWWDLAVAAAIVALWPLQEWLIHVFILHYRPRRWLGRSWDFAIPRSHRAHHREPWRVELIFIPMRAFAYALVVLAVPLLVLDPAPARAATAGLVYFALALHYEWVHFLVHTRYRPRGALYRRLWRNHRLHHFKNEHYWYGVTRLEADRLLGTAPAPEGVAVSETAKTLA